MRIGYLYFRVTSTRILLNLERLDRVGGEDVRSIVADRGLGAVDNGAGPAGAERDASERWKLPVKGHSFGDRRVPFEKRKSTSVYVGFNATGEGVAGEIFLRQLPADGGVAC